MKIILHKIKIRKFIHNKKSLGFVPTMGGLHKGHMSLIKRSIKECDMTVVSIFVNKQQFNRKTDYNKYPRFLNRDISLLRKLKIDVLYLPKTKHIYPNGYNKKIKINPFKKKLCGKFRPYHFEAVVDVVDRFIKIINPNKIYLGEKDFQQLIILKDFIIKNHPKCKVISCKTVREKNGLACSTRNFLLNNNEKLIKKIIPLKKIKNIIYSYGVDKIDYIEILNVNKIIKPYKKTINYKIFLAYYLRKTRLIDNI